MPVNENTSSELVSQHIYILTNVCIENFLILQEPEEPKFIDKDEAEQFGVNSKKFEIDTDKFDYGESYVEITGLPNAKNVARNITFQIIYKESFENLNFFTFFVSI